MWIDDDSVQFWNDETKPEGVLLIPMKQKRNFRRGMTMPGLKIWLMTAISYIMPVAGSVNQLLKRLIIFILHFWQSSESLYHYHTPSIHSDWHLHNEAPQHIVFQSGMYH